MIFLVFIWNKCLFSEDYSNKRSTDVCYALRNNCFFKNKKKCSLVVNLNTLLHFLYQHTSGINSPGLLVCWSIGQDTKYIIYIYLLFSILYIFLFLILFIMTPTLYFRPYVPFYGFLYIFDNFYCFNCLTVYFAHLMSKSYASNERTHSSLFFLKAKLFYN